MPDLVELHDGFVVEVVLGQFFGNVLHEYRHAVAMRFICFVRCTRGVNRADVIESLDGIADIILGIGIIEFTNHELLCPNSARLVEQQTLAAVVKGKAVAYFSARSFCDGTKFVSFAECAARVIICLIHVHQLMDDGAAEIIP